VAKTPAKLQTYLCTYKANTEATQCSLWCVAYQASVVDSASAVLTPPPPFHTPCQQLLTIMFRCLLKIRPDEFGSKGSWFSMQDFVGAGEDPAEGPSHSRRRRVVSNKLPASYCMTSKEAKHTQVGHVCPDAAMMLSKDMEDGGGSCRYRQSPIHSGTLLIYPGIRARK